MEDSIDKILNELEATGDTKEEKELVVAQTKEIDASDTEEIEQALIDQTLDDRKKADQIFDLFYTKLGLDKDRTEGSKEAINKSLELKILASKNMIELLKLKKQTRDAIGVFVNAQSGRKVGIDIDKLQEEID